MGGHRWWFLCVCVHGLGGASCILLLPCSIPSPPRLPAPFLLVYALAVLLLAAALGGLFFHTWWCCLRWRSGALGGGVWLSPCFSAHALQTHPRRSRVSLDSVERINENEEKNAPKEKINTESVFTDLKPPP